VFINKKVYINADRLDMREFRVYKKDDNLKWYCYEGGTATLK